MLIGTLPFEPERKVVSQHSLVDLVRRIITEPAPNPKSRSPNLSDAVAEMITIMLSKEPRSRFRTAEELLERIAAILAPRLRQPMVEWIRSALSDPSRIRSAFIASQIIGPPKALTRRKRSPTGQ